MKKLAFLFLTYDNLKAETLWKNFFEQADPDRYSIYVHPKNPDQVTQPWLKKRIIENLIPTEWGRISAVRAEMNLLTAAFQDLDNHKTIFLSDSCIPLYNFHTIYNHLMKDDKGYFNFYPCPENLMIRWTQLKDRSLIRYEEFMHHVPNGKCFTREMINFFMLADLMDIWDPVMCADENYFGTVFARLGKIDWVHKKDLLFARWENGAKTFSALGENELNDFRKDGYFFLRKVTPGFDNQDILRSDNQNIPLGENVCPI